MNKIEAIDLAVLFGVTREAIYMRRMRLHLKASGLTTERKPRVNKQHPELAGLGGKTREYHTAFMRKQRAQDKANWANQPSSCES